MTKDDYQNILHDLADARDALNKMEFSVRQAEAALYLQIKRNPGRYGLDKATIKDIEATVDTDPDILELRSQVIAAKHEQSLRYARYDLAKFEIEQMKQQPVEG